MEKYGWAEILRNTEHRWHILPRVRRQGMHLGPGRFSRREVLQTKQYVAPPSTPSSLSSVDIPVFWSEDMSLYLMEGNTSRHYIQYKDRLYLDASPGAFAPLGFTADNSTLSGGETTWAWTGALGFLLWTPTGDPLDASPGSAVMGQGFEWVDVEGYPGLRRAYWNQTLFDEVWAGRDEGHMLMMCNGDYRATIEMGDSP